MRIVSSPLLIALGCLLAAPGIANATSHSHAKAKAPPRAAAAAKPALLGKFGDWQAATLVQAGQTICYAFTRPTASTPLPGRGDVFFTITERAKLRDTVSLSAGFAYATGAEVTVTVDGHKFPFYTSGRSAFARDGAALIKAFAKGSDAVASSPAPKGKMIADQFSLKGFGAAFNAAQTVCPEE